MTVGLLDANVLVALVNLDHVFNAAADRWFAEHHRSGWATCPLTENAVLRIVSHPHYPGSLGGPEVVASLLRELTALPGHVFWPDDISLLDRQHVAVGRVVSHAHLTDTYLLALARARGGRLVTFDRRLQTAAVAGGAGHLEVIG